MLVCLGVFQTLITGVRFSTPPFTEENEMIDAYLYVIAGTIAAVVFIFWVTK